MNLNEILLAKEKCLLEDNVRSNPELISEYLDSNFIEFTTSGKEYRYKYGDTFEPVKNSCHIKEETFRIKEISKDSVLTLYQSEDKIGNKVNRSSIWILKENIWKIVFHQGTKLQ
jgi:hypothetical protein